MTVSKLNHKEFSSRGGKQTLKKYGRKHFVDIGIKGAEARLKKYGKDYFKKLSAFGVAARKAKAEAKKLKNVTPEASKILLTK